MQLLIKMSFALEFVFPFVMFLTHVNFQTISTEPDMYTGPIEFRLYNCIINI
jgi:hypothetical protein